MIRRILAGAALLLACLFCAPLPTPAAAPPSETAFGLTRVWAVHLDVSAKEYAALPPTGGFGFGPPQPPRKDDKKDKDKDSDKPTKHPSTTNRRKSTIISMLCDRDPMSPQLTLNFVGADTDECTYFFEARSSAACGGIEVAKQTLSPGGVFGVIAIITFAVYIVGGCVYSRMVLQQRGWRQLPNYALWAGIGGFLKVPFLLRCLNRPF